MGCSLFSPTTTNGAPLYSLLSLAPACDRFRKVMASTITCSMSIKPLSDGSLIPFSHFTLYDCFEDVHKTDGHPTSTLDRLEHMWSRGHIA